MGVLILVPEFAPLFVHTPLKNLMVTIFTRKCFVSLLEINHVLCHVVEGSVEAFLLIVTASLSFLLIEGLVAVDIFIGI